MTWDDLRDKPVFRDVAAEFVEFVRGAEWVIHNAPFDVGFLDAELARIEAPAVPGAGERGRRHAAMAREAFPGKRNNLDALCERFGSRQRATARCTARCSTRSSWPRCTSR